MEYLHAVIVKKPMTLGLARKKAYDIGIARNKRFYRETVDSYRFRNISRKHFLNLRTIRINDNLSVIVGNVKEDTSESRPDDVPTDTGHKSDELREIHSV